MSVVAVISEVLLTDSDRELDGVQAECTRCGHRTESFGVHDASIQHQAVPGIAPRRMPPWRK